MSHCQLPQAVHLTDAKTLFLELSGCMCSRQLLAWWLCHLLVCGFTSSQGLSLPLLSPARQCPH